VSRDGFPLAHPVAVAAVTLLLVNDHFLKHAWPGFVTGKLSDVAGMIFFPILLASVQRRVPLLACCIATALVFALVKTAPWANDLYRVVWGAMQWPFRAAHAWLAHREAPGLARVVLVRDPSDLLAVPFVCIAFFVGGCGPSQWTVAGSTEPETVEVPPGHTLERQVIYDGIGGSISVIASLSEISTPDAKLRIRQVDGEHPDCTSEETFDRPGGVIEHRKTCEGVFDKDDRTIFIDNIGTEPITFVYRTRGEMTVERKSSSGSERVDLTEIRRGLPATPTP
jgi:hypothetical protein